MRQELNQAHAFVIAGKTALSLATLQNCQFQPIDAQ